MSRRTLPLESPYWVPITEAFEWREQQTDSVDLAVHDFNQKLGAGKLRALVRRAGRPIRIGRAYSLE